MYQWISSARQRGHVKLLKKGSQRRTIRVPSILPKPTGIYWDKLSPQKLAPRKPFKLNNKLRDRS